MFLMLESDWLIHIHITHMHSRNYPYINLLKKLNEIQDFVFYAPRLRINKRILVKN